ncbi:hypothetical protein PFICI_05024 [Pestalotiopsis fici W106-1]|uniref:BZIP domain-containing protein n=1 Tax=Pestalotiopsis fici (strain W106-1 / CGMCC3.15140) TaxID=1229662 RepID=W3XAM8_PESFW|nr:uncharacterized protein PFICI_05024 [Pestalotiopsis fici W106-1]ETS83148.1 hypothetical protein PFICI_05024 [Pestalotiopsis fici W106-1]
MSGVCPSDSPYSQPFFQQSPHSQGFHLSEEELSAQKAFMDNYGLVQTTGVTTLAAQVNNNSEIMQQDQLNNSTQVCKPDINNQADAMIPAQSIHGPVVSYGDNNMKTTITGPFEFDGMQSHHQIPSGDAGSMNAGYGAPFELIGYGLQHQATAAFPASQYPGPGSAVFNDGSQYSEHTYYNTQQIHGGMTGEMTVAPYQNFHQATDIVDYGVPSGMEATRFQVNNQAIHTPEGAFIAPKPEPKNECDVAELVAMAREYAKQEPGQVDAQSNDNVLSGCVDSPNTPASSKASTKPKKARKTRSSTRQKGTRVPTAMQCAPISIARDRNGKKRVEIGPTLAGDGLPQIKVHPGSDDDDKTNPLSLAEAVARPRDEQLTLPRPGVPLAGPRVKVPYLTIDDTMSREEQLRRAAHNQQISEVDRADRRARNNESARRNRERTKQAIVDAQAKVEEGQAKIKELEEKLVARDQEIKELKKHMGKK